jgi:hypothetical protein
MIGSIALLGWIGIRGFKKRVTTTRHLGARPTGQASVAATA